VSEQPAQRRRDAIVSAAARFFAERGYAAVGMRDVAEAVGVRGASLYHHFASKEEILYAICLTVTDGAQRAEPPAAGRARHLLAAARALVRAHLHHLHRRRTEHVVGSTSWPRSRRSTAPWWTGTAATTSGGCGR
jgi:AcrR family transcriptional regulator